MGTGWPLGARTCIVDLLKTKTKWVIASMHCANDHWSRIWTWEMVLKH